MFSIEYETIEANNYTNQLHIIGLKSQYLKK